MATKRTTYLGIQSNSLADMIRMYWENVEAALREYWGHNLNEMTVAPNGRGWNLKVFGYNMAYRKGVEYRIQVTHTRKFIELEVTYTQHGEALTTESKKLHLDTSIGDIVEATDLLGIEAYRRAPANGRNETASTTYSWDEEAWRQKCLAEQVA